MSNTSQLLRDAHPRDAADWAQQAATLKVTNVPAEALKLSGAGHAVLSPLHGFGQLWQKVYQARLQDATVPPGDIIRVWKEHFPQFWPKGNRLYAPVTGIVPAAVAPLSLGLPGGIELFVRFAGDESFTFMTPQGHLCASWITCSAFVEGGCTVIQVHLLLRATDPLYEMGTRLHVIPVMEHTFWRQTLSALMAHFNVEAPVRISATCLDPHLHWSLFWDGWQHAAIGTVVDRLLTPVRWMRKRVGH